MKTPQLTLIYAEGCPACEDAKPHFAKLARKLPNWQFGLLNVERPGLNLDFPVNYTPTLHLSYGGKRYTADPFTLKRPFTEANMQLWLNAVVAKFNSQRSMAR